MDSGAGAALRGLKQPAMKSLTFVVATALIAALLVLTPLPAAQAAQGDLDTTFSDDGIATFHGPPDRWSDDVAREIAVDGQGRAVVLSEVCHGTRGCWAIGLTRFLADGSVDTTFGTAGSVIATPNVEQHAFPRSLTIDPQGRIVVSGSAGPSSDLSALIGRFTETGALDETFGTGGWVQAPFTNEANDAAIDGQGRIVFVGGGYDYGPWVPPTFTVSRLTTSGALDPAFGGDGTVEIDLEASTENGRAVGIDPDGKVVAVAENDDYTAVVRLGSDGSFDTGFSGDGITTVDLGSTGDHPHRVAFHGSRIYVGGSVVPAERDLAVAALTGAGAPDTSFAGDGTTLIDFSPSDQTGAEKLAGLEVDPDGNVLVSGATAFDEGQAAEKGGLAIARLTPAGQPDANFGTNGRVVTTIGTAPPNSADDARGAGMALLPSGKILMVGNTGSSPKHQRDLVLARHLADGSLDTTFSEDGLVTSSVAIERFTEDTAEDLALGEDGKIVTAGRRYAEPPDGGYKFLVTRTTPSGGRDSSFGNGGAVATRIVDGYSEARAVAVYPDGRILAAGNASDESGARIALVRYLPDGTLDETFSGDGILLDDVPGTYESADDVALDGETIVVAGNTNNASADMFVTRYLEDGSRDATFSGDGFAPFGLAGSEYVAGLAIDAFGRYLVGNTVYSGSTVYFGALRVTRAGAADSSYGYSGGWTTIDMPGGNVTANAAALDPAGRLVVGGDLHGWGAGGMGLARFTAAGHVDYTFSDDGMVADDGLPASQVSLLGLAVDSFGRIAIGGKAGWQSDGDMLVGLYSTSGNRVEAFSGDGLLSIDVGGGRDVANGIVVDTGGNLVVGGTGSVVDAGTRADGVGLARITGKAPLVGTTSGTLWSWGANYSGQAGDSSVLENGNPTQISDLPTAKAVAAGSQHALALTPAGEVWGWGANSGGQLGDGSLLGGAGPRKTVFPEGTSVKAISAGAHHSLAVDQDGNAWGWGANHFGVATGQPGLTVLRPTRVNGLGPVTALSAGAFHNLGLDADGNVWAWGRNYYGQLGDGSTTDRIAPAKVGGLPPIVAVAAGGDHSLALDQAGNVWAWGANTSGQLGDGTTTGRPTPVQVSGFTGATQIAADGSRSAARKADGSVYEWGFRTYSTSASPVQVTGVGSSQHIAAGSSHALSIDGAGVLRSWGWNDSGQLGNGQVHWGGAGVVSASVPPVDHADAGQSFTVAVAKDGGVWAWGANHAAQLGQYRSTSLSTPQKVAGIGRIAKIDAAGSMSLAITPGGTLWTWGSDTNGSLGWSGRRAASTPGQVPIIGVVDAAAGGYHTIAATADGEVWTWGSNWYGQLGTGNIYSQPPRAISGVRNVIDVDAGENHSIAVRADGTVWTWGSNSQGQLGYAGTGATVPTKVEGLPAVASVSAGSNHSVAVGVDGSLWAWGMNLYGQVGDSTTTNRFAPVKVIPSGIAAASAGGSHTVAVDVDGDVWAWGAGRLVGDGSTTQRNSPVELPEPAGFPAVKDLSAGGSHTLAAGADGSLWSWGYNSVGQLGDGTQMNRLRPARVPGAGDVRAVAAGGGHSLIVTGAPVVPPTETVTETFAASGTLTTDGEGDGATADDVVETTVTTPVAGTVTIKEGPVTEGAAGYLFLGRQVQITAPEATASSPLQLTFRIDASELPSPLPLVKILRNGVEVPNCTGAAGTASPDPCVASRTTVDGDLVITVRTSKASKWLMGISAPVADAGGPYVAREGQRITLDGGRSTGEGPLTYSWATNPAASAADTSQPTFTPLDDPAQPVSLTVTDANGNTGQATAQVLVTNVAPKIAKITLPADAVTLGKAAQATIRFRDAGIVDSHRVRIGWGDGTSSKPKPAGKAGTYTATAKHVYGSAGSYRLKVTIVDDDGGRVVTRPAQKIVVRKG